MLRTAHGGLHVEESGSPGSPAILFLHGAGQSAREWRRHMERLPGFHCLAPDLPGHGRSNQLPLPSRERLADGLAMLIETRVPSRRAHVVGISWGALLALVLVSRHPDSVDHVVADGTPLVWPRLMGSLAIGLCGLVTPVLHTRPVLAMYRDIVDAEDLRLATRRAYLGAVRQCVGAVPADPAAGCPTLLVAGEQESQVRRPDAQLAALMPHAQAWYAPGLSHCWQREAPDLHRRMVEAWCTGRELPSELRPEPTPGAREVNRMRRRIPAHA